jgi:hypothetical protein
MAKVEASIPTEAYVCFDRFITPDHSLKSASRNLKIRTYEDDLLCGGRVTTYLELKSN